MTRRAKLEHRNYFRAGVAGIVIGAGAAIVGVLIAHFTGLGEFDDLGREIYPVVPRGWFYELSGQVIALGGVLLMMAGTTLAFLYERKMTWARASIGAALFTGLMMILFGVIPNQWLTLTQAVWEWTPQKILITIPPALVLNNDVAISYAALKDAIVTGYILVAMGGVAFVMIKWQDHQKNKASGPPPKPVSTYGRPMTKVER